MKCMSPGVLVNPANNSIRRWDSTTSKYKIVSSVPTPELDELDENIFVVRRRIGKRERRSVTDRLLVIC